MSPCKRKRARWLTPQEIADGAIKQIGSVEKESIVGQIEPYDIRPK